MKGKNKTLGCFQRQLKLDILKLMMKRKKKVLGVFDGSYLSNLVRVRHRFFIFFKGSLLSLKKTVWETCSKVLSVLIQTVF